MELERSKKIKYSKPRELSPPPPVLTLDELEERLTDTDERQPSTSGIRKEGATKEVERDDKSANGENIVKSDEKLGGAISIYKSSTDSKEISGTEKTIECDARRDDKVLSETKKEEGVENVTSASILVDNIYLAPTTFASSSLLNSKEATKANDATIYPNNQLNEMKEAASRKISELSPLICTSGRVQEHDITDMGQSMPLLSETQYKNKAMGERIANAHLSFLLECNEYGLLTENQLLAFYQNELYETVEEFVDEFLEHEEFPQHSLHEYLERYKIVCEHIDAKEIEAMDCEQLVKECAQASWTAENRVIKQEGRCGEQKYATGSSNYLIATFHPEKATELSRLLKRDVSTRLDSSLSLQIQMRSLALQIQWRIVEYNNIFMVEHRCNIDSPPCCQFFLPGSADTVSRRNLRNALSDLFHYLRYPNLPSRFISAVSGWISELVAVLLKACTSSDQQYLLCQVLRLVSPVSQWAAPLLQSYIEIDSMNDRLIIDNYIVMMSLLLSSIRGRENFLRRIMNVENGNNAWVVINDDGAEKDGSVITISETDLIAFLNQFNAEAAFAKAVRCFAITLRSDPINQALTLVAFELVLIKIFNDGLYTYGTPNYRQFCKQIGYALRQSVICSAEFLKVIKDMLSTAEAEIVQKEFDRIVLHAVYYIVSKQNLGLLQFVVDLPYNFASEACRMRCQILLKRKMAVTVAQLYEFPEEDLPNLVDKAGNLFDKLPDLPSDDRIYMISALASIISASDSYVDSFTIEILNVCFLDVSMRDHFYKVGAETIGILIDKHPYILQKILLFVDRNLDSLEEYAVEVLSVAPLSKCRLSVDDVGIICGKWLINRPANHPARVLGSMNWGTDENGKLWLQPEVHIVCADTLIKGHMAQCKTTNGLISKSWNKVAKLAAKVPDYEHQFDAFCWDILVRLKLPLQADTVNIQSVNDLVSFFVFVIQRSLLSVDEFLSSGLSLWSELITSGCYVGSVVILARLISSFPDAVTTLISHEIFIQCLDRLLLCDLSSYAVQFIAGANKFPGPTIRLLSSAITYHMNKDFSQVKLSSWIQLLCCKRPTQWNTDKSTLYLLGTLVRIAFTKDQIKLLGIPELLKTNYAALLQQWKDGSKSVLSWFTSDDSVPPIIDSANMNVSPWASFALLLAEQQSHEAFYETLYQTMSKHPKNSLDQSVKVFFKAGIFAHLENLRDEVLSIIIIKFQNACRHYNAQCDLRCRMQRKAGALLLQRNIRAWCTLRNWNWFKLYGRIKPLIKGNKKDEETEALQKRIKELEENFNREEKLRKEKESEVAKLMIEKQQLFLQVQQEKDISAKGEERVAKYLAQKTDVEKQFASVNEQLAEQEDRNATLSKIKNKIEHDNETLKLKVAELETTCKRLNQDKQVKDHQLRSLQDEIRSQDEVIAKISKEKKHQEETNRKFLEEIQSEEDKINHLNKVRNKLEQTVDEIADNLERERRIRQDIEKSKRKAEGELKIAQENIDEFIKQKQEMENALKKKDIEIASILNRIDDEQSTVNKMERQLKEQIAHYHELEEELQAERQARLKIERSRSEIQKELEELSNRLDEAGGATQAQIELNKKREAESAKLRRDLEEVSLKAETALANLRKKQNDAMAELSEQLDTVQKGRAKIEKEKESLQREIDDLRSQCDLEAKQRQNAEKFAKQLEAQLAEAQLKLDEQTRSLQEAIATKNKLKIKVSDTSNQIEEYGNQIALLNRIKQQLTVQLEEVKRQLEQESQEKHSFNSQLSNLQLECQQLRDTIDEELSSKTELQRLLSKANAETQQWKTRYEDEEMNRSEELEEARQKLQAKVQEMQQALDAANNRINSLEKARLRLAHELEDAQMDADRANSFANSLEKKQKAFDKTIEEWKRKCDLLTQELEASQREARNGASEIFRLRNMVEETGEQLLWTSNLEIKP
ncbi:unnamed protein product [Acanthocheilonema viteae]|uniref:Myosin tail domain-containing protein n=1 Tax=Acanthocheilonema viteae TaxID=6277 RepID=A0A498SGE6_ACAVI|nr:unnamed protein product [Acanthocheilonema viteae]